jgi:hypothetical protein
MSEVEKLRALLAEARERIRHKNGDRPLCQYSDRNQCEVCGLAKRIDAALAEPVESDAEKGRRLVAEAHESWTSKRVSFEEAWRLKDTQRIAKVGARNGVAPGTAFADLVEKLERERDEARAEVASLKAELSPMLLAVATSTDERDIARAKAEMAYQRGAEAMREAAMGAAWHSAAMGLHKRIKEMPVPEDKP